MEYRAVGNRCAVNLTDLRLPMSPEKVLSVLLNLGFRTVDIDLTNTASACIGRSRYRRAARPWEAPDIVDCSSFTKWLYSKKGIWLPRRSIQQSRFGMNVANLDIREGDLIFTGGSQYDYHFEDPENGISHVGLVDSDGSVIHAAAENFGVIKSPIEKFLIHGKFRCARRLIDRSYGKFVTLEAPSERSVETSDDLRWIVLQTLKKK